MFSIKKTAAYVRNSADIFQENSIKLQEEQAYRCAALNALTIDEFYRDTNTSAKKNAIEERKELSRLLSDIRSGLVGNVIIYKRDRLARNTEEYMEIYENFKAHKVNVYFSAANEFPMHYTPQAFTIEYLLASFAEHEEVQLKERISDTNASNFKEGKNVPGALPYGYKRCTKTDDNGNVTEAWIEVDPDEKEIVQRIYDDLLSGNFDSIESFRKYLRDNGITTKNTTTKKGTPNNNWAMGKDNIIDLIRNPLYKGLHRRNFQHNEVAIQYPEDKRIIPIEKWEKAQITLDSITPKKENVPHLFFLLKDIVKCAYCDKDNRLSTVVIKEDDDYVGYYQCTKHRIKIHKDPIERDVLSECKRYVAEMLSVRRYSNKLSSDMSKFRGLAIKNAKEDLQKELNHFTDCMRHYLAEKDPSKKAELLSACNESQQQIKNKRQKIAHVTAFLEENNLKSKQLDLFDDFFRNISELDSAVLKDLISDVVFELYLTRNEDQPHKLIFKSFLHAELEELDETNS